MIIDLLSVSDEPLPFNFKIAANEIDLDTEGVQIIGDIEVIGELRKSAAKTDVRGSIKAPVEIECTRCLTPVKRELDIVFDVDFVDRELFPDSRETHLESRDLDTDVIEGNELDLTQVAREQILLSLPEQVLCREDCKGICATCGSDLNESDCKCGGEEIDPRWAALKDLK
jgi:Predicted metal-binding, possibly nucleic acid-binding protein